MTRIAALYDVHGNLEALEAALEDRFGAAAWTSLIDRRPKTAAP